MPNEYTFQFWVMDPGVPPPAGTVMTPQSFTVVDTNGDGFIRPNTGDTVDGFQVNAVWMNDTVTTASGQTITGVTFYLTGGPAVFMPTDGTVLTVQAFASSTYVTTSTQYELGPVPCFTPGTLILTPEGERPVEELRVGDLVVTRDHGPRPVRWIGRRAVDGSGVYAPVRFAPGAIGNARALTVSPQHRMLVEGWRAELFFGAGEVLAAAAHLVNGDTVHRAPVARAEYLHLLFDRHEIVFAEGVATESFHPGDHMLTGDTAVRAEVLALFPELAAPGPEWDTARPVLRRAEARLLAA